MEYRAILNRLIDGKDLTAETAESLIGEIMAGNLSQVQISALLVALRAKGETAEEIKGAVRVMRQLSLKVRPQNTEHLIDTCGTGGDGSFTFNVSTGAALLAAAAGARVAKHGNRAVSGASGSADVLAGAGATLELSAEAVAEALDRVGFGFIFAPAHHAAMKYVAPVRRELGVRTIFNLLGPLTNPAGCVRQLIGLFDARWLRPLAEVLRDLGSAHVLLVHSADGMDEISPFARTHVVELRDGNIDEFTLDPADYGIAAKEAERRTVSSPEESLEILCAALKGEAGNSADFLILNAGAALYVAGLATDIGRGIEKARAVLKEGGAFAKLTEYVNFTKSVSLQKRD